MTQLFEHMRTPDGFAEFSEFLVALQRRVTELEARNARLEQVIVGPLASEAEIREQEARWWNTYNATLSKAGIFAHGPHSSTQERERVHSIVHATCAAYANYAHGPLASPMPLSRFDEQLLTKDGEPLNLAPEITP